MLQPRSIASGSRSHESNASIVLVGKKKVYHFYRRKNRKSKKKLKRAIKTKNTRIYMENSN